MTVCVDPGKRNIWVFGLLCCNGDMEPVEELQATIFFLSQSAIEILNHVHLF